MYLSNNANLALQNRFSAAQALTNVAGTAHQKPLKFGVTYLVKDGPYPPSHTTSFQTFAPHLTPGQIRDEDQNPLADNAALAAVEEEMGKYRQDPTAFDESKRPSRETATGWLTGIRNALLASLSQDNLPLPASERLDFLAKLKGRLFGYAHFNKVTGQVAVFLRTEEYPDSTCNGQACTAEEKPEPTVVFDPIEQN